MNLGRNNLKDRIYKSIRDNVCGLTNRQLAKIEEAIILELGL